MVLANPIMCAFISCPCLQHSSYTRTNSTHPTLARCEPKDAPHSIQTFSSVWWQLLHICPHLLLHICTHRKHSASAICTHLTLALCKYKNGLSFALVLGGGAAHGLGHSRPVVQVGCVEVAAVDVEVAKVVEACRRRNRCKTCWMCVSGGVVAK